MTMAAAETPSAAAFDQVRALADDAERLAADARTAGRQVEDFLQRQVATRPYQTLLIAAGAGYVLGGGLASSLTREVVRLVLRTAGPSLLTAVLFRESPPGTKARSGSGGDGNDLG
jgi:hypothetical protein